MDWNKLLIVRGFESIVDLIDEIPNTFLKGLARIGAGLIVLWFVLWYWLRGFLLDIG